MPQSQLCTLAGNDSDAMVTAATMLNPIIRQLMEELANYIHRNPTNDSSEQWRSEHVWRCVH